LVIVARLGLTVMAWLLGLALTNPHKLALLTRTALLKVLRKPRL
jgi:hypothetical protein